MIDVYFLNRMKHVILSVVSVLLFIFLLVEYIKTQDSDLIIFVVGTLLLSLVSIWLVIKNRFTFG